MKCIVCGKEIEKTRYNNNPLCSVECFEKDYWNEIIKEKDQHIVIDGVCYCDGGAVKFPDHCSWDLGFGGREFHIRYFDGRTLVTNNLWYQGHVPEEYRNILVDEAEFCNPQSGMEKVV